MVDRVLNGPAKTSRAARQAAFENRGVDVRARSLVDKVARHAWKVTRGDIAAAKTAVLSEDEIFELTICAALGQATRQLEAALTALDEATSHPSRAEGKR